MAVDIRILGLRKKYRAVTALDGLDLEVFPGEMFGLIGPDGAGKTTTMRILCGLIRPDAGACWVGGKSVRADLAEIRSFIGYMPQRFSLYPDLTVDENLRFFAGLFRVNKEELEPRMKRLLEFSRLRPFINRRAAHLSGGMKQKLALSCALIHTPRILILDEPTTGVDPVSRREFWEFLRDLRSQGVTILISTPYMDEAAKCDRVAFIHAGRILLVDSPSRIPALFTQTLVEIRCDRPMEAARALRASGRFGSVQMYGDRIHASGARKAPALIRQVNVLLNAEGIRVASVEPIDAKIEDVFIERLK